MPRAHPRPCGEHCSFQNRGSVASGSSPPVRGARYCSCFGVCTVGLIPARAGSTASCPLIVQCNWAHPRPCGEHEEGFISSSSVRGSSPPVRGAHAPPFTLQLRDGLIPARAGSTTKVQLRPLKHWAHPRPCGEHSPAARPPQSQGGSSPPVRGAPTGALIALPLPGLIPARAGSTYSSFCALNSAWAHPRPCGEHVHMYDPGPPDGGSSPPVRGALPGRSGDRARAGLIPARAGSTTA